MEISGEQSVIQLIRSINEFDGTIFLPCRRITRAIISPTHLGVSFFIKGGTRSTEIFGDIGRLHDVKTLLVSRSTSSRRGPILTRSRGHHLQPSPTRSSSEGAFETMNQVEDPAGGAAASSRAVSLVRSVINKSETGNWDRCLPDATFRAENTGRYTAGQISHRILTRVSDSAATEPPGVNDPLHILHILRCRELHSF